MTTRDANDDRWRTVVEHSLDGILLTYPDGRVIDANPAACAMLGRTVDQIRAEGRDGLLVVDDTARNLIEERNRTSRARGVLTLRRGDGTTFLADTSSQVFTDDRGERMTSIIFRDVTETERNRRALAILAEADLGSSLDLSATLRSLTALVVPRLADVCTVDLLEPDGVVRAAVAHRDPARVLDFQSVRRRNVRDDVTQGVDWVLRSGKPSWVFEVTDELLQTMTSDPGHLTSARSLGVRSFLSVPLVARGRTIGALTVMSVGGVPAFGESDLSLVKAIGDRAAAAIDNAHRHAEIVEARKTLDEVLSIVAHDLRSPLNAIQLLATAVSRQIPEESRLIRDSVRRGDRLIRDLLLAAKADAGRLFLELEPHDVGEIVDEVRRLHVPLADGKQLHLTCTLEGPKTAARIDRHRVLQMLGNVVANAIKFTPPGGSVEVIARTVGPRVVFVVRDTGAGIAPEELPHVFDRYWQGARARHLGAGLGLSIARGIAIAHGGDIEVESALGRGTTFTISLPVS